MSKLYMCITCSDPVLLGSQADIDPNGLLDGPEGLPNSADLEDENGLEEESEPEESPKPASEPVSEPIKPERGD